MTSSTHFKEKNETTFQPIVSQLFTGRTLIFSLVEIRYCLLTNHEVEINLTLKLSSPYVVYIMYCGVHCISGQN